MAKLISGDLPFISLGFNVGILPKSDLNAIL
jgi:hypothetical protein